MEKTDFERICHIPIILDRILGFLPAMDLMRLQSVCKAWRDSSMTILKRRKNIIKSEIISYTELTEDLPAVKFHRTTKAMKWTKDSRMYETFLKWKNMWMHPPQIGICVCMSDKKKKNLHYEVENVIRHWMPPESKIIVIGTIDSIVCVDANQEQSETSVDIISRSFNFLSLPNTSEKFSVEIFNLKADHLAEEHTQFCHEIKESFSHCDVKLIFALVDRDQTGLIETTITSLAQCGVVVIGSLFNSPIIYNPNNSTANETNSKQDAVFVCFKGSNVQAASVLVGPDIDTSNDLDTKIHELEKTLKSFCQSDCSDACKSRDSNGYCASCNSQTLGIMIACCVRADAGVWYDEDLDSIWQNIEQKTFRSIIPNVPLCGTFGVGEIGASINLNVQEDNSCIKSCNDLFNAESTIFAVIRLK